MRTLRHKLLRDLWRLRYQCMTIALLVGCGIASFVAAVSASASVQASRDAFYADARFADVFAHLKLAPRPVLERLRELPGVASVDGRVTGDFRLVLDGSAEPVVAHFVSVSWPDEGQLDQTRIQSGRQVQPGASDEIVLSVAFAETLGLVPGSTLTAVIDGRLARLKVVGTAVSPEFVYSADPRTGLPDPWHFGIAWMDGDALAKATGLVGGFNDVAVQLAVGADERETIDRVDAILEPYGGLGAVGRADQPSAKLVEQKVAQLQRLARSMPVVFLGVAAFLLHVLLSRIVGTQREQIATLKALGYRTRELTLHYLEFALAICALGTALGWVLGGVAAKSILGVYAQYFRFPAYIFRFDVWTIVGATVAAVAAGVGGTFSAVRKAVSIPPAEAMRPEAPPSYHRTRLDELYALLRPVTRMVLRDAQRQPWRLLLSAGSIALAAAIVVAGSVMTDSMDEVLRLQFEVSHREDVTVTLRDSRPWRAVRDAAHIPGVRYAEGERQVPVRLRAGPRMRTTAILGLAEGMELYRLLGADRQSLGLLAPGLSLSRPLGESLGRATGRRGGRRGARGRSPEAPRPGGRTRRRSARSGRLHGRDRARAPDGREPAGQRPAPRRRPARRRRGHPAADHVCRPSRPSVAPTWTAVSFVPRSPTCSSCSNWCSRSSRPPSRWGSSTTTRGSRSRSAAGISRPCASSGSPGGSSPSSCWGSRPSRSCWGSPFGLYLGRLIGGLSLSTIDRELLRIPVAVAPTSYVSAACVVLLAALVSALIVRRQSDRLDLVAVLKARD